MKIIQAHNYYCHGGGEDLVVAREGELLVAHGHLVKLLSATNEKLAGMGDSINTALHAHYSDAARARFATALKNFSPDLVHVHNFFPLLTPSIYDACSEAGVPVVQTLHNYRIICPGALLARKGAICEECIQGTPYRAAWYRCYRDSLPGSLTVARMVAWHRRRGTWGNKVTRFIALTEFAKSRFVMAGVPADRISVKPNFVAVAGRVDSAVDQGEGAVYVGRLSPEKGVRTLMAAWTNLEFPLQVVGAGQLAEECQRLASPAVHFAGSLSPHETLAAMEKARFLVVPSICYEGFPLAIVEAFASGRPVIASRLGSMAEIVTEGITGLLFEAGNQDDLAAKVRWAAAHPAEMKVMGQNARQEYETKYTPEANYRQLLAIYRQAIDAA